MPSVPDRQTRRGIDRFPGVREVPLSLASRREARHYARVPSRLRTRLSSRSLRPLVAFFVFSAIGIAISVSGRHGLRASAAMAVCALLALAAALWGLSLAISSRGQDKMSESG